MPLHLHQHHISLNLPFLAQSQVTNVKNISYFCPSSVPFSLFPPFHPYFPLENHLSCPCSLSSSGAQGAWLISDPSSTGGDITPVPLLTSPDLDALCEPETSARSATLPLPGPSHGSSLPTPTSFSSPFTVTVSAPPAQISSSQSGTPAH